MSKLENDYTPYILQNTCACYVNNNIKICKIIIIYIKTTHMYYSNS